MPTKSALQAPDALAVRDEAREFAALHAGTLASELIRWQDTGLLPDGKLRDLAAIWSKLDESGSMALAESSATRATLDALVKNAATCDQSSPHATSSQY